MARSAPRKQAPRAKSAPDVDSVRAEAVADWVRDHVRLGKLVPGQRLVEADIVRDTGASRGRVREALRRLESEGLVAIEEFRGASVKRLGADEVRQIYRARMVLEGLAAAEFAAADDAPRKQRLLALQTQMDENESAANHDRFARLNAAWHRLIIEGADNAYVAQFLARLTVPIYRLLFSTFYAAHRIRMANADHRIITAAIAAGRADEAERAMRAHIGHGLVALTELNSHFEQ